MLAVLAQIAVMWTAPATETVYQVSSCDPLVSNCNLEGSWGDLSTHPANVAARCDPRRRPPSGYACCTLPGAQLSCRYVPQFHTRIWRARSGHYASGVYTFPYPWTQTPSVSCRSGTNDGCPCRIWPSEPGCDEIQDLAAVPSTCTLVNLTWAPVTGASSFEIARDGLVLQGKPAGTATSYQDPYWPDPASTYVYTVKAYSASGAVVASGQTVASTPSCYPNAFSPNISSDLFLLGFDDNGDGTIDTPPFPASYATAYAYTDADSLAAYVRESSDGAITYGQGVTHGWLKMPHPHSYYCSVAPTPSAPAWGGCSLNGMERDLVDLVGWGVYRGTEDPIMVPADVYDCGGGGSRYGTWRCGITPPPKRFYDMMHELGHNLGKKGHAAMWRCPNYPLELVGPSMDDPTQGGCQWLEYGGKVDPMGAASFAEWSSYTKEKIGFIPESRVQHVTQTGVYRLSPSDQPNSGVVLLKVHPPGVYAYYAIEYRIPLAGTWDAITCAQYGTGVSDSCYDAHQGVYVYLGTLRRPETAWGSDFGNVPNGEAAGIVDTSLYFTPSRAFYDPYRKICVKVQAWDETGATLAITFGASRC